MTSPRRAHIKSWELCQTCYYHIRCMNTTTCCGCDMHHDFYIPAEHHKTLCICNSIRDGGLCGHYINNKEKETMEYFEKELSFIKNYEIREKTKKVIDAINPTFYEGGASTTGKYHPTYALGYEGLYRHSCAAVRIAEDLMSLEYNKERISPDEHDYVIAALILHDSCKCGKNWTSRYTLHEHPIEAADFIKEVVGEPGEMDDAYAEIVSILVASHMGQWNTNYRSRVILPKPTGLLQYLVHEADYLSSRKYLEFVFDDEVVELKENSREIIKEVK